MSSGNYYRSWMDKTHLDPNTNLLTEEYTEGIGEVMRLVQQQPEANTRMLRCPCSFTTAGKNGSLNLGDEVYEFFFDNSVSYLQQIVPSW